MDLRWGPITVPPVLVPKLKLVWTYFFRESKKLMLLLHSYPYFMDFICTSSRRGGRGGDVASGLNSSE